MSLDRGCYRSLATSLPPYPQPISVHHHHHHLLVYKALSYTNTHTLRDALTVQLRRRDGRSWCGVHVVTRSLPSLHRHRSRCLSRSLSLSTPRSLLALASRRHSDTSQDVEAVRWFEDQPRSYAAYGTYASTQRPSACIAVPMAPLRSLTRSLVGSPHLQAMAKMGKAEATVDPEFDQAAANFKEQHNKTKKLSKFVHGYEQSIAGMRSRSRSRLMPCAACEPEAC